MLDYSQLLDESEIYESGNIENAFIADSLTTTKTLHRTNAAEYQQKLLEGEVLEFPIASSHEFWDISDPSPGSL